MELGIRIGDKLAGTLSHDPQLNRFAFRYAEEWLAWPERFALSPQLPLPQDSVIPAGEAHSAAVRQFFENLLPEGQALDDAAQAHLVSKSNLMGLLIALGRETSGAIRVELEGTPLGAVEDRLRPLPLSEISLRIRHRPHQPFSVWDGKVRLSIAGYQDKIAALRRDDQWFLAEGERYASSHILKPEPVQDLLHGLTSNEFFCMRLAARAQLSVAPVELIHVPDPVLVITRFDRVVTPEAVRRLHVIDGCQALGLSTSFKYERPYGGTRDVRHIRDGASLPRLFGLLRRCAGHPTAQQLELLRWVIFQVLIGNTDAHAKNLSFHSSAAGLALAPAYDLVCGLAFDSPRLDNSYAMAIGDAFSPEEVTAYEWANFARLCQLKPKLVSKQLLELSVRVAREVGTVQAEAVAAGADPEQVQRIVDLVRQECARQRALAPQMLEVDPALL